MGLAQRKSPVSSIIDLQGISFTSNLSDFFEILLIGDIYEKLIKKSLVFFNNIIKSF
jgi:hypothetical protein